jgi:hypothetical protein
MTDNETQRVEPKKAAQLVADELTSSIKNLIEVDESAYHELTEEKRFDESDITIAFLVGVIKASTLGDMLTPRFVGQVAIKVSEKLGFVSSEAEDQ